MPNFPIEPYQAAGIVLFVCLLTAVLMCFILQWFHDREVDALKEKLSVLQERLTKEKEADADA